MAVPLDGPVVEVTASRVEVVPVKAIVREGSGVAEPFDDAFVLVRDTVRKIASVVRHQVEDEVGVGLHAAKGHKVECAHDEQQRDQDGEDRHMDEPLADPFDHALSSSEYPTPRAALIWTEVPRFASFFRRVEM